MAKQQSHPYRAIFRKDPMGWQQFEDDGQGFGYVGALHKANIARIPHRVANEYLCGEIGRFLRLTVPPLAISRHGEKSADGVLFSTLDFNYERDALPPITPKVCVDKLPFLSAGILLFDILIANPDRHENNLYADDGTNPRNLIVFDHDYALLGVEGDGVARLQDTQNSLGLSYAIDSPTHHCFVDLVSDHDHFHDWYNRIYTIPDWFIDSLCKSVSGREFDLVKSDCVAVADFLKYRKRNLEQIVGLHKDQFASMSWG